MKLEQLSQLLANEGFDNALEGDPNLQVQSVNTLEDALPGEISFLSNPKYKDALNSTRATAVIVNYQDDTPPDLPVIKCNNPYGAIAATIISIHGHRQHPQWGISDRAIIDDSSKIGDNANIAAGVHIAENVTIGANAVIYPGCYIADNVTIGDDVTLYPNVIIYDDSLLGNHVTLHAGTIIGQDGLGYAQVDGGWLKIPQIGRAVIDDNVEMGANCAIDRATVGETRVKQGTKFSDAVVLGHGTKIGERCMFVAQVGIAGSVDVGNDVQMGGQVGVSGHLRIGDNALINAKSGIWSSVEDNGRYFGIPASNSYQYWKQLAQNKRIPEMKQQIKKMTKQIEELTHSLEQLNK